MKKRLVILIFIVSLVILTSCKSENAVFIDNGKDEKYLNSAGYDIYFQGF